MAVKYCHLAMLFPHSGFFQRERERARLCNFHQEEEIMPFQFKIHPPHSENVTWNNKIDYNVPQWCA